MTRQSGDSALYDEIAEELNDPKVKLADLDARAVARARAYTKRAHKKWPPRPVTSGWCIQVFSLPAVGFGDVDFKHGATGPRYGSDE